MELRPNIFIIGMTNRLDLIDPALLRAGRLAVHIKIPLPDLGGREKIFGIYTKCMSASNMVDEKLDLRLLSEMTENFSGSEIEAACGLATSNAVSRVVSSKIADDSSVFVTMDDFLYGIKRVVPISGKISKHIDSILPDVFTVHPHHEKIFGEVKSLISRNDVSRRLNVVLFNGKPKAGKSTLSAHILKTSNCQYGRYIRAMDVLKMSDHGKSQFLTSNILDAHDIENSVVIIDDVENILSFAKVASTVNYSNHIYQTLITCLKTPPDNKKHRLTIILNCASFLVYQMFEDYATATFNLDQNIDDVSDL